MRHKTQHSLPKEVSVHVTTKQRGEHTFSRITHKFFVFVLISFLLSFLPMIRIVGAAFVLQPQHLALPLQLQQRLALPQQLRIRPVDLRRRP